MTVYYLTIDSNVNVNYGIISGWWAACYVGYILNIRLSSIPVIYTLFVIVVMFFYSAGLLPDTFHDMSGELDIFMVVIVLGQGFVFISPILINEIVKTVTNKCITKA